MICLVSVAQKLEQQGPPPTPPSLVPSLRENFCPGELNRILFLWQYVPHLACVLKTVFVGRVSRQRLPVTGALGDESARFQFAHLGAPPIFVFGVLLSSSVVLFLFVSHDGRVLPRCVHSVVSPPCNIPKVAGNLLFCRSVLLSAFVNTSCRLSPVKKQETVESVFRFVRLHCNYASKVFAFVLGRRLFVPCSCYHVFCCLGIFL